ncbi:MAG: M20 family metallopeptidase [Bacillota bacterium]|nr:M20 family metallopeptidase [Eubacteriales bacterium]MDD4285375.1 M20 family metallopeptidase [Eubacteriales bacterium]MDI9491897.1 M20 family metallopeptidase [Bacillota bacterium]HPF18872.1 M20 family metallopeptidase [Bacillota bacterium]
MEYKPIDPRRKEELKALLENEILRFLPHAEELSNWLFRHPEISGREEHSAKKIAALLEREGFRVTHPIGGVTTAFRAVAGNETHRRKLAIMAEYDALPDLGHACGHNVSAAISVLAGLALRPLQDALDLDVHVIGTPAEERGGGKVTLVENGVFDGYDMAMMVHLYDSNLLSPLCLALMGYTYTFEGKAAHSAAAPWEGKNALNAVQLMFHGVDMMRQHVQPDVRIHGIIREGGQISNIVPEKAVCEFCVRAKEQHYAEEVQRLVDDCAKGAALATQTLFEKTVTYPAYADLKKNEPGLAVLAEVYGELGLELNGDPDKIFASTDAGNVSYVCPTFHPSLQIAPMGTALHTLDFAAYAGGEAGRKALPVGARIIGLQALNLFSDDRLLDDVARHFSD